MSDTERRSARRFQVRLPLRSRQTSGSAVGEAFTESKDVSPRGIFFLLPTGIKQGSSIEIEMTLPHEITLAGPVRVRCRGRVQRTESKDGGKVGIAVAIERYDFLRADKNAA